MRATRLLALTAGTTFALDQLTKWLVVQVYGLRDLGFIEVFPPFLQFQMAWNYGINFGLFSGQSDALRWGLITLAVAIAAGLAVWGSRQSGAFAPIACGLVVGGAIGNAIDRVIYGAVADFLNVSCCGIDNPYSWNIADGALFLGVVGLILMPGPKKGA